MTAPFPARSFTWKLTVYAALMGLFAIATLLVSWPWKLLPQCLLGAMYAHGVELEHELLHQKYFSGWLRSRVGFWLGLPMLVEFTRYTLTHSHHHRAIGTPEDTESFAYDFDRLQSPGGLLLHLSLVAHYAQVVKRLGWAIANNLPALRQDMGFAGQRPPEAQIRSMRRGYLGLAAILAAAVGISGILQTWTIFELWAVPLLVANPIHALIELPEHWGCRTHLSDITANTRTILPSPFLDWLTNGNCWHVEHHLKPALPMADLPALHQELAPQIEFCNDGYLAFYKEFFSTIFPCRVGLPDSRG